MGGVNNTIDKFGRKSSWSHSKVRLLRGLPGYGFKLTKNEDFDIDTKRLKNVGEPTESSDDLRKCVAETRKAVGDSSAVIYAQLIKASEQQINYKFEQLISRSYEEVQKNYVENQLVAIRKELTETYITKLNEVRASNVKMMDSRYNDITKQMRESFNYQSEDLRNELKRMMNEERGKHED